MTSSCVAICPPRRHGGPQARFQDGQTPEFIRLLGQHRHLQLQYPLALRTLDWTLFDTAINTRLHVY